MALSPPVLKASGSDNTGLTTVVTASFSMTAGAELVVSFAHNEGGGGNALAVDWNGHALTARRQANRAGTLFTEQWTLDSAPGESGVVTITLAGDVTPSATAYVCEQYGGTDAAPFDKTTSSSGASSTPTSTATAALAQNDEIGIGAIGTAGPSSDTVGSWSNGYTAGSRAGATGGGSSDATIATGYKIVADGSAQTAAKTGITSRAWAATVITLKQASASAPTTRGPILTGVG